MVSDVGGSELPAVTASFGQHTLNSAVTSAKLRPSPDASQLQVTVAAIPTQPPEFMIWCC